MTGADLTGSGLAGCRVFLTGHTGFKGSWLALWLDRLGCEVTGFALPAGDPSHYGQSAVRDTLREEYLGDIRDADAVSKAVSAARPDLVMHLAAQSLVRRSYADPLETWSTNVMGTANVLEAVRTRASVKAVLVVTTDKCYENREWHWGYRETDPLGGHDPYSASKAATELVVQSYRKAFFYGAGPLLASARAGNVIGGGDWSEDRIIPDLARAAAAGQPLLVRSPDATRPWQHVLDCLSGYLVLAERLLAGDKNCSTAFNFGPMATDNLPVRRLLERLGSHWPEANWVYQKDDATRPHEASLLYLDSSKARQMLNWSPRWDLRHACDATATWYRSVIADSSIAKDLSREQLDEFCRSSLQ